MFREPTFHMQVERTYLKWLRISVCLASIGRILALTFRSNLQARNAALTTTHDAWAPTHRGILSGHELGQHPRHYSYRRRPPHRAPWRVHLPLPLVYCSSGTTGQLLRPLRSNCFGGTPSTQKHTHAQANSHCVHPRSCSARVRQRDFFFFLADSMGLRCARPLLDG